MGMDCQPSNSVNLKNECYVAKLGTQKINDL